MKLFFTIILSVAILASGVVYFYIADIKEISGPHVRIGKHILMVDIADNTQEHWQGLSGRESLGPEAGMLFVFDSKQIRNFVMRNMKFPLDIIWLNDNTIVQIDKNLFPEGARPVNYYHSDTPVNYVIEVNAGLADKWGITVGQTLSINIRANDY